MSDSTSTELGSMEDQKVTNGTGQEPLTGSKPSSNPLDQITELLAKEIETNDDAAQGYDAFEDKVEPVPDAGQETSEAQTPDEGGDAEGGGDGDAEPDDKFGDGNKRLADLAKELGTSPKALYDKLMVATGGDGREVSLGELKDRYQEQDALFADVVEGREALATERAETVRTKQVIELLLPYVGEVPQEVKAQVNEQYEASLAKESRLFTSALPELRDQAKFDQFRTDVTEHMSKFGFSPAELTISDHRLLLLVHDAIDKTKLLDKYRTLKPERPKPAKKVVKKPQPLERASSQRLSRDQQIDRVARLLG